jgi:nicotinamidase-related amidase
MTELMLDPKKTAIVVIDLQRGILAHPTAPHPVAEVVSRAAQLCGAVRAAGGTVVLVHVTPSPDGRDALHPLADLPQLSPAQVPAEFAEFVPEMQPQPGDVVVTKRNWGAFYGTELDLQLRRRGVDTIIVCGVSTNIGVETTARDAYERGYNQVFVEDASSTRAAEDHARVFATVFPRMGRVRSTTEVLAALEAPQV